MPRALSIQSSLLRGTGSNSTIQLHYVSHEVCVPPHTLGKLFNADHSDDVRSARCLRIFSF